MFIKVCFFLVLLSINLSSAITPARAVEPDQIRIYKRDANDQRWVYPAEILSAAMTRTEEDFGPWEVLASAPKMSRDRTLVALKEGRLINVHSSATRVEWEEQVLPIRIPIRKGLLGYRLLLIHRQNQERFAELATLEELQNLSAGTHQQWSITKILRSLHFNLVEGTSYAGLFPMLQARRFDYFPRGVNEVFKELAIYQETLPDLMIEPTKALYLPLPTYFFVSPQHPRLAERIQIGLERMLEDGSFNQIFEAHHAEHISKAHLAQKQIFILDNPLLPVKTPLQNKRLWLDINKLKSSSSESDLSDK